MGAKWGPKCSLEWPQVVSGERETEGAVLGEQLSLLLAWQPACLGASCALFVCCLCAV